MRKLLTSSLLAIVIFASIATTTKASEGIFELRNQVGEAARCYITSGIMQNQQFQVLTLCRDILYPGGTEVYQYVAWATPIDGEKPIKLGALGLGKQLFKTSKPFNSVFVTKELSSNPREPGPNIIMRGNLQSIEFLSQRGSVIEEPIDNELITEDNTATPAPESVDNTDEDTTTPARNVFRFIALAGMLGFVAIFGVVLIIFVVTRR